MLFICVVFCCWDLQLSWSVGGDEVAVADIVGSCAEIAGQRAKCRGILRIYTFHASTFCVICLWLREESVVWCLLYCNVGSRDFSLLLIVKMKAVQRAMTLQNKKENCWRLKVGLCTFVVDKWHVS